MFVKGKSGNPGGRPKLSDETKKTRASSYEEMCKMVIEIGNITVAELDDILKDPKTAVRYRTIAYAYSRYDYNAIKYYEDRVWGKAKENIDIDIPKMGNLEIIIKPKDADSEN